MALENVCIYIKGEQSVEISHKRVTIGDVVEVFCMNEHVLTKVKSLSLLHVPNEGKHRYVVSVLKVIEKIQEAYPNAQVENLGDVDLIITYEEQGKKNPVLYGIKVTIVLAITFVGSAFSIMTFNNDVDVPKLFSQIYEQVMGVPKTGVSILELTYSIGITIGILVFFNHFGKKRFSVDPTPIEVEMRSYENEIQTTLIQTYEREGREACVDEANNSGIDRTLCRNDCVRRTFFFYCKLGSDFRFGRSDTYGKICIII